MGKIIYWCKLLRYNIYRMRLVLINKNRKKRGEVPMSDRYGAPRKPQSLCNHPTQEEIRKHRESIKPLGLLFYIDYKLQDKNKNE